MKGDRWRVMGRVAMLAATVSGWALVGGAGAAESEGVEVPGKVGEVVVEPVAEVVVAGANDGENIRKAPEFLGELTPLVPGEFGEVLPFWAKYTFGWSEMIDAAEAEVSVFREGGRYELKVGGKSLGLAGAMWKLDATHEAWIDAGTLRPNYLRQEEKYRNRTIWTEVKFEPDQLWRKRVVSIDEGTPRWKRMEGVGIFDILGGLLFVRSQPLADGDEVRLVVYPGDSPFLAEVTVKGRETVTVMGGERAAIRLDLKLQKIETKGKRMEKLVEHGKFRSGTVWVSDDELRVPLKAEVSVFIGWVHGEMTGFERK